MVERTHKQNWITRHREEMIGAGIYLFVVFLDFLFRDSLRPLLGGSGFEIAALTLLLLLIWIASRMLKRIRNRDDSVE